MFEVDDIFINEELFVKNYLSFLIDSDDEVSENFDNQSIHYLSYEEENSVYCKSTISSNVIETWSPNSFGSITTAKETPSNVYNICKDTSLPYERWSDPNLSQSFQSELSFLKDFRKTNTSTPIKKSINNKQAFGVDAEQVEMPTRFQKTSNMTNVAPLSELNMLSQINKKSSPQVMPEINMKTLSNTLPAINNSAEVKHNTCEVCLKESGPKSITLADFFKKPTVDHKSEAASKSSNLKDKKQAKDSDLGKENSFCKFCYKNGELMEVFTSHITKKSDGTVICPILRNYVCELCGQTGDNAHTRKYCLFNPERFQRKPLYRRLSNGVLTSSHNHK